MSALNRQFDLHAGTQRKGRHAQRQTCVLPPVPQNIQDLLRGSVHDSRCAGKALTRCDVTAQPCNTLHRIQGSQRVTDNIKAVPGRQGSRFPRLLHSDFRPHVARMKEPCTAYRQLARNEQQIPDTLRSGVQGRGSNWTCHVLAFQNVEMQGTARGRTLPAALQMPTMITQKVEIRKE